MFRANPDADCADLSMELLIGFAAKNGLPLTFKDNAGNRYISKASEQKPTHFFENDEQWENKDEFKSAVQDRIGTEALWYYNTLLNPHSFPAPGDLIIRYRYQSGGVGRAVARIPTLYHTALVYAVYPPGVGHPRESDQRIPDFPGNSQAVKEVHQTIYFRGTVDPKTGATVSRKPDLDAHVDLLNWRSTRKGWSELILFANAYQIIREGFQFCRWAWSVTDNWRDWDGKGDPPKHHKVPIDGFN